MKERGERNPRSLFDKLFGRISNNEGSTVTREITMSRKVLNLIHEIAVDENVNTGEVIRHALAYYGYIRREVAKEPDLELRLVNRITGDQTTLELPPSQLNDILERKQVDDKENS